MNKSYEELSKIESYQDRFRYLNTHGRVGDETFGSDRYLNQALYHSDTWKDFRRRVILRDMGNDMGHPDHPIQGAIYIHHINPISRYDILNRDPKVLDMNNAICVSFSTHNAIHYGDESQIDQPLVERTPFDTCPWKKGQ